jgi:formate hydrogenlyase subunit 3/multisubunit Na+/H+ antiporter MnhD subunit
VVLTALSTAGFPLLAGFPPRVELWLGVGNITATGAVWLLVGLAGLMIGALRQLTVLTLSGHENPWIAKETLAQRGLLGAGMLALLVLGLVPHAPDFIVGRFPLMFEHLGR